MKNAPISQLKQKTTETIIEDLELQKYSLLGALNCRKLRLEVLPLKIICVLLIGWLRIKTRYGCQFWEDRFRDRLNAILRWMAPARIYGNLPENRHGLVFAFNHPSLGEVLRILNLVYEKYPENRILFPVNLQWFEALSSTATILRDAGIRLTPIITPALREKMLVNCPDVTYLNTLQNGFNQYYLKLCERFGEFDIIVVAPSATRQATLYRSIAESRAETKIEPASLSLLAMALGRNPKIHCCFTPIAVVPPSRKAGLNLFRSYELGVGRSICTSEAKRLAGMHYGNFRGHLFDWIFTQKIAMLLHGLGADWLIAPDLNSDSN